MLTLVVTLGYLDVVTQDFQLLRERIWAPDEVIDELKALQNRPVGEIYPILYLDASANGISSVTDWNAALNRFAIVYENRLPVD